MSELTTQQASQFGVQVSGDTKFNSVLKSDGTREFSPVDPTKPVTIGYSPTGSNSSSPVEFNTGSASDSLIATSTGMKIFDLREGDDTARIEGGSFIGKLGTGKDTIDIVNSNGTIVGGQGSDTINIGGNSKVTIEYNPGDFGSMSSPEVRMRQVRRGRLRAVPRNVLNKRMENLGQASDVDKITGFSSDDVLRISKGALPGGEKLVGADGVLRSDALKIVNSKADIVRSRDVQAMLVYDKSTGDLYYNPANFSVRARGRGGRGVRGGSIPVDTRPVKLLQMDANLDLTPTNIVIF